MRMPPTSMPPHLTFGSQNKVTERPLYFDASAPHAATKTLAMLLHGFHGFPSSPSKNTEIGCSVPGRIVTFVILMVIGPANKSSAFFWSDLGTIVGVMSIIH